MGINDQADVEHITASQIITSSRAILFGYQIGADAVNNPTITVYTGTDNTGKIIVPTVTYLASALGMNGLIISYIKKAYDGIYVEITTAGTVSVAIDYRVIG
jgi:hypothetical protein